jgi:hypothetical protein
MPMPYAMYTNPALTASELLIGDDLFPCGPALGQARLG